MSEIIFSYPHKDLSPNSRIHWAPKAKLKKSAKEEAYFATLAAKAKVPASEKIAVWIDIYPPDRRKRDVDNVLASLKPHLDGIAEALGIDDSRFVPYPYILGEVVKGGKIRIKLTDMPERP